MPVDRGRAGDRGAVAAVGAYAWLVAAEEAELTGWAASVHGRAEGARYPRARRLAALRAGEPVVVAVHELPAEHRPAWAGPLLAWGDPAGWHGRQHGAVEVSADDSVVRFEDDGRALLAEYRDL